MSALGEDLRLARERAGISLHGLSERTKIREGLLDAIEHNQFGRLPAGLLTRGFLRAYAREVGLEPESIVKRYNTEVGPPALAYARPQPRTPDEIRTVARRIQFGLAALVAVGIIAFVIYVVDHRRVAVVPPPASVASTDDASTRPAPAPAADTVQPAANVVTPPAPAPSSASAPPLPSGRLTLSINPTAAVWVEATADGRRAVYSLVYPNEPRVVEANEQIDLRVGDAGAFQYSIDGVRGRSLGVPGKIANAHITRSNRADFHQP